MTPSKSFSLAAACLLALISATPALAFNVMKHRQGHATDTSSADLFAHRKHGHRHGSRSSHLHPHLHPGRSGAHQKAY
ncbi:MAG: hypothetical protein ACHP84_09510 [Caulobacterales bacterium]